MLVAHGFAARSYIFSLGFEACRNILKESWREREHYYAERGEDCINILFMYESTSCRKEASHNLFVLALLTKSPGATQPEDCMPERKSHNIIYGHRYGTGLRVMDRVKQSHDQCYLH